MIQIERVRAYNREQYNNKQKETKGDRKKERARGRWRETERKGTKHVVQFVLFLDLRKKLFF